MEEELYGMIETVDGEVPSGLPLVGLLPSLTLT